MWFLGHVKFFLAPTEIAAKGEGDWTLLDREALRKKIQQKKKTRRSCSKISILLESFSYQ